MAKEISIEEWKSQIRRGTLEFCILLLISHKPCYGYDLISRLEKWPILTAKESTIYPLLRRLLKEEYLSSFWQEPSQGLPPRKYYTITERGRDCLAAMTGEWNHLLSAIAQISGGSDQKENREEEHESVTEQLS